MVNFDVILGMDWLSPCHAMLDFHAKTVTLVMPGFPWIEWRGSLDYVPSIVISYLKSQRIVGKGCLSYLAFVRDVGTDTRIIDSVPVVRDFLDVFPTDLPGMPPDKDIDFGIDLVPGTKPISTPLYHMTPPELKELKEQLQELLDKGDVTIGDDGVLKMQDRICVPNVDGIRCTPLMNVYDLRFEILPLKALSDATDDA
ncbi:uncharacterized protein [Nicotiana tomentosiformis]|uniref:uncharacterized protein n=1 Tax=Nicotiana tomentosiformis TaxID=4098 RepID=UPI00388CC7C7